MSLRGKLWILFISAAIAIYALIGGLPLTGQLLTTNAQQPINDAGAQIRILESVLQHIQNDYVDEPDLAKVRSGALRGLVGGLDPYSSYLTPEQVAAYTNGAAGKEVGIGAEFSQVSLYLYVVSVVKGSSADKAGLKAGDVIEYIGTKATRDISLYDARQMILGEPGTEVEVRVLRSGQKPVNLKIKREAYNVPSVESRVEGGVGIVTVYSLDKGEAEDVRSAVEKLTGQNVDKIVLDIRGVATGDLEEAAKVSNLFIGSGELAKVVGRDGKILRTYAADPAKQVFRGSLAVVMDLGTAGAGESIAAAVIESKRGEVVGERSFGAGTEQKLFTLRGGDGLLLTVARWASPSGTPFLGDDRTSTGVKPTVEVKRPETPQPIEVEELIDQQEKELTDPQAAPSPTPKAELVKPPTEDIQLKKAIEVVSGKAQAAKA
jgi:carboxyl-terminal processing protease